MSFDRFVAIDWTGAKGERHAAIAVAGCAVGTGAPEIVRPGHRWSRAEVLDWLQQIAARGERTLIGFDFSFSLPHADHGAFFPGDPDSPTDARALWAEVDAVADPHFEAHAYIERRRRHYWLGSADGDKAARARLRAVELVWAARKLGAASSVFALVGAAQCGKASLSGMRLLHRLDMPVWPFDALPATGPALVEIYCRTFAADGGVRGKIRSKTVLDAALARLDSAPAIVGDAFADHIGDALISAAGMRRAATNARFWTAPRIGALEGWTFGVASDAVTP